MRMLRKPLLLLSNTAKTAVAIWLAQSPPAPPASSSDSLLICARLAASAKLSCGQPHRIASH